MKRSSILAYFAAVLFLAASVFNFISGATFRGIIGLIGSLSFFLAAIHWGKSDRMNKKDSNH